MIYLYKNTIMNYQRILISEAEKKRILGIHDNRKKNPTTRLINEQTAPTNKEFPICVRNASSTLARIGDLYYIYVKKTDGGAYLWGKAQGTDGAKIMYDLTKDQVSGATNDNGVVVLSTTNQTGYKYYCRCDSGSCRPKKYEDKELRKDECGDDNPCKPCGPEYRNGCKDPGASKGKPVVDGIIYKVQGCIGTKQDSFFGLDTEKKLKEKTGKITFNENEVDVICKGQTPGGQTPGDVNQGTKPGDDLGGDKFIEPEFQIDVTQTPVAD